MVFVLQRPLTWIGVEVNVCPFEGTEIVAGVPGGGLEIVPCKPVAPCCAGSWSTAKTELGTKNMPSSSVIYTKNMRNLFMMVTFILTSYYTEYEMHTPMWCRYACPRDFSTSQKMVHRFSYAPLNCYASLLTSSSFSEYISVIALNDSWYSNDCSNQNNKQCGGSDNPVKWYYPKTCLCAE